MGFILKRCSQQTVKWFTFKDVIEFSEKPDNSSSVNIKYPSQKKV